MIYFGSFFAGIINGLFASGAGQIVVFILAFVLKLDAHKARGTSIFMIGIITIFTIIRYLNEVDLNKNEVITVTITGLVCGYIGSRLMKKISPLYLNLISGIFVVGLSVYSLIRG